MYHLYNAFSVRIHSKVAYNDEEGNFSNFIYLLIFFIYFIEDLSPLFEQVDISETALCFYGEDVTNLHI